DAERVVAADGDEGADVEAFQVADDLLDLFVGRIGARGAEDRAAHVQDAGHALAIQRDEVAFDQPGPAVAKAEDFVAVEQRAARNRANHRIQSRAIAAAGQHRNFFHDSFGITPSGKTLPKRDGKLKDYLNLAVPA